MQQVGGLTLVGAEQGCSRWEVVIFACGRQLLTQPTQPMTRNTTQNRNPEKRLQSAGRTASASLGELFIRRPAPQAGNMEAKIVGSSPCSNKLVFTT